MKPQLFDYLNHSQNNPSIRDVSGWNVKPKTINLTKDGFSNRPTMNSREAPVESLCVDVDSGNWTAVIKRVKTGLL